MRCPKVITINDLDYKNLSSNFELRIGSKKSENLDEIEFCDITVKAVWPPTICNFAQISSKSIFAKLKKNLLNN